MDQVFLLKEFKPVMQEDSLLSTHPVNRPLVDPGQIVGVFDFISYKKGASILHMLAQFIGMQTFRRGLKRYLKAKYSNVRHLSLISCKHWPHCRKYGNAVQDHLWAAFTIQAKEDGLELPTDIQSIMETWTLHSGYPVVTIARNYSARTATAKQERFILYNQSGGYAQEPSKYWWVPMGFTTNFQKQESQMTWLSPKYHDFRTVIPQFNATPDQWVIFNTNRGISSIISKLEFLFSLSNMLRILQSQLRRA